MVAVQIKTLNIRMMAMACAGRLFTSLSLSAPTYWEIIEEMAERDCPKTQMSMDKNEETMPTAARETVAFKGICPTMAASVSDKIGSETPAIMAGMASRLICLLDSVVFKTKSCDFYDFTVLPLVYLSRD